MKRRVWILLSLCLVLSGCKSPYSGSYVSVTPYEKKVVSAGSQSDSVSDYRNLYSALEQITAEGIYKSVIPADSYAPESLEEDLQRAIAELLAKNPVASYAVRKIDYEIGKNDGLTAVSVRVHYAHDRAEILKIKHVEDMDQAIRTISTALNQCDRNVVLKVAHYEALDLVQVVESYARRNPHQVMEMPQVEVNTYPKTGESRVVELRFFYKTSRDSLKAMQEEVQPVFTSAALYVKGGAPDREKYSQLYSFLLERYDYQIRSSITPVYSLVCHGVGDSKAFALTYSVMCRQAELECMMVTGTYQGQSHYWTMICDEEQYYHLDLLNGSFEPKTDAQMTGYVWDYSAYPACK